MLPFLFERNKAALLVTLLLTILIISNECSPIQKIQENLGQQHSAELENTQDIENTKATSDQEILDFLRTMFSTYDYNKFDSNIDINKRALKRQGILERMKNKMYHDLSKFGWD